MTDAQLIAEFIQKNGVTRVASYTPISCAQLSRSKRADWSRGIPKTPRHRYNLALAYARAHGLDGPRWTDCKEDLLLLLRSSGRSWRQIAELLEMSKAAVQSRHRYLLLGRRLRAEKIA